MADKVETVKIPKAMLDNMEERLTELSALKEAMRYSMLVLAGYDITAVVTSPPSARHAVEILDAVRVLARLATAHA